MFYSQIFLARKGPLGTVWCAAHLQHKLKKSHYMSTNVEKTAERIMCPETPIALRLSGHLLLGVVRIYSKQVDYLYADCDEVRKTINMVFTTVSVDLANDATHAPVHSITLPEKFDLDAMELDDYYNDRGEDPHLKSQVDVTLPEQIPTGNNPYIIITFDEHELRASTSARDDSGSGPTPMEEDAPPDGTGTAGYPSPSNRLGADGRNAGNRSSQDPPSIEKMRDARHGFDFNSSPILPDRADPDPVLEEQINKDKGIDTPATKGVSPNGAHSSSHNHDEQHSFGRLDSPIPFGECKGNQSTQLEIRSSPANADQSPELQIRPSPPASVHQSPEIENRESPPVVQRGVRRNKKRCYDEFTVLSNAHIKKGFEDTSNVCRKRKNGPLSSLAIWKQNKRAKLRGEDIFLEPFITGCSPDLQGICKEDAAKRHRVSTDGTHQEANVAQTPDIEITEKTHQETNAAPPSDKEIEVLRNNVFDSPARFLPETSTLPSPNERSCFTPDNSNMGMQSERLDMTDGNEVSPTTDKGASANLDSEVRTPDTFHAEDMYAEGTALSDIPELVASPGELRFLEQDDNSPAGSQGTPVTGMLSKDQQTPGMSSRTRAVAQYLERRAVTPMPGNSDDPPDELSLNKILQGKPRKICARMFYETLVLKSLGLVEARQESPYGDITLKVTPKLSKGKFAA